jgi:hypothetical protein
MLLSFQRPSHLFGEGDSFPLARQNRLQFRSGPPSIAPNRGREAPLRPEFAAVQAGPGSATLRTEATRTSGQDLHRHDAAARAVVEVDQDDLLPGPEREPAAD